MKIVIFKAKSGLRSGLPEKNEFFSGSLLIREVPAHQLAPGEGARFVFDLNLPEGKQYMAWIIYSFENYIGNGTNYYSDGCLPLEHDAKYVTRGSNARPFISDGKGDFVSYATGTVGKWTINIATWDVNKSTPFTSDTFPCEVTWK